MSEEAVYTRITPRDLGFKLQKVRKLAGMTQEQVADKLDMARTTLIAIEKGDRRLSNSELHQFAQLYKTSVHELLSEQQQFKALVPQFRTAFGKTFDDSSDWGKAAAKLEQLSRFYCEVEELVGDRLARKYPPIKDIAATAEYIDQAAADTAAEERNRLGLGDSPIGDLVNILEDVGLRIFHFDMYDKDLAGIFAYDDIMGGCIGLSNKQPMARRRWTLAHEYGHFLSSRLEADIATYTSKKSRLLNERFADGFAANFLMPQTSLNRKYSELLQNRPSPSVADLCGLAHQFGVSLEAITLRLENIRRLKAQTWEGLKSRGLKPQKAMVTLGYKQPEIEPDKFTSRYMFLAVQAHQKGLISMDKLCAFLEISDEMEVRQMMDKSRHSLEVSQELDLFLEIQ